MPFPIPADDLAPALRPFSRATTLPAQAFTCPEVYAAEGRLLFEGGWLCAGRVDQVANPGDLRPLDLLGDRLVLVRGLDERVRVLSRICRHRGAELLREAGNARSFSCPYHAWTYDLEGRLRGAPMMSGGLDRDAWRLPEVRSEIWEGWVFVNFDGAADPLGPQLAPLSASLVEYGLADLVAVHTATYASPFNWKVLVDNFMEAYHHVSTHRDSLEPIFPAARSRVPDNEGPYSVLHMPTRPELEAEPLTAAVVYPFHLFAPSAEGMAWYQLLPQRHDDFELRIFNCVPKQHLASEEGRESLAALQALTRRIHEEDIGACEATFAGLQSRSFERGPLGPLERSIWQFNQWWISKLGLEVGTGNRARRPARGALPAAAAESSK